jgi:hypothetical protein
VDWAAVSGITQVVSAVLVAVGFYWMAASTSAANKSRKLTAAAEVLQEIGSDEMRAIRHRVLDSEPPEWSKVDDKRKEEILRLAVAYDRIGFLTHEGLDHSSLMRLHGEDYVLVWDRLASFIIGFRDACGRQSYCKEFQREAEILRKRLGRVGSRSGV